MPTTDNQAPANTSDVSVFPSRPIAREDIPADRRVVMRRTPNAEDPTIGFAVSVDVDGNANDPRRHKVTYDRRTAMGFISNGSGYIKVLPMHESTETTIIRARTNIDHIYARSVHGTTSAELTNFGGALAATNELWALFPPSQGRREDYEWSPPDPTVDVDTGEVLWTADVGGTLEWMQHHLTQSQFQLRSFFITGVDGGEETLGGWQYLTAIDGTSGAFTWSNITTTAEANTGRNTWLTSADTEVDFPANWLGAAATVGHARYFQIRSRNEHNTTTEWSERKLISARNSFSTLTAEEATDGSIGPGGATNRWPGVFDVREISDLTTTDHDAGSPTEGEPIPLRFRPFYYQLRNTRPITFECNVGAMVPTHVSIRRVATQFVNEASTTEALVDLIGNEGRNQTFEYAANNAATAWNTNHNNRFTATFAPFNMGTWGRSGIPVRRATFAISGSFQASLQRRIYQFLPIEIAGAAVTHAPGWSTPMVIDTVSTVDNPYS